MDESTARAGVTQALHDAIDASDGFADGEFVTTWVAVVAMASIENTDSYAYYLMTPSSEGSPPHVARGLLHEGLASLDAERRDTE